MSELSVKEQIKVLRDRVYFFGCREELHRAEAYGLRLAIVQTEERIAELERELAEKGETSE